MGLVREFAWTRPGPGRESARPRRRPGPGACRAVPVGLAGHRGVLGLALGPEPCGHLPALAADQLEETRPDLQGMVEPAARPRSTTSIPSSRECRGGDGPKHLTSQVLEQPRAGSVVASTARSRRPMASLSAAATRSLSRASACSSEPEPQTTGPDRPRDRSGTKQPRGSACPL